MKQGRHIILGMTRVGLRCSCDEFLAAPSELREQPAVAAFNYLLDQHKLHWAYAKSKGMLEETNEPLK